MQLTHAVDQVEEISINRASIASPNTVCEIGQEDYYIYQKHNPNKGTISVGDVISSPPGHYTLSESALLEWEIVDPSLDSWSVKLVT